MVPGTDLLAGSEPEPPYTAAGLAVVLVVLGPTEPRAPVVPAAPANPTRSAARQPITQAAAVAEMAVQEERAAAVRVAFPVLPARMAQRILAAVAVAAVGFPGRLVLAALAEAVSSLFDT